MGRITVELTDAWSRKLIARADADAPDYNSLEETARALKLRELARLLDRFGNPRSRPLIQNRSIRDQTSISRTLCARSPPGTLGLVGFYAVDVGELEPREQDDLLRALQSLHSLVESAAFEPSYRGAGTVGSPARPVYRSTQRHLDALGVDDVPDSGEWYGVGFADLDVGWNLDHEALRHIGRPPLFPASMTELPEARHGTAVLGVIVGSAKIQGIARGATVKALIFPACGPKGVAEQLVDFLDDPNNGLQFGDILLIEIEQEAGSGTPEGLPLEVQPAVFRVIQLAVSRGIVVIEAAGNGAKRGSVRVGWDLDKVARDGRHAQAWRGKHTGDAATSRSGAITVSGCRPSFPERVAERYAADPRLNFGSRVDCYGFGSAVVTSGDNFPPSGSDIPADRDDPNAWYDCGFGMTSAAAAMVTGAALMIQRMAHEELGHALSPFQLRTILRESSCGASVQRHGRHVGIVPHLAKVRDLLRLRRPGYA